MKKILAKFGIIQNRTLTFDISSNEFFEILNNNVVSHRHREAIFQKTTHTYRGKLKENEFRLKEVHKVFDNTRNDARIHGTVNEQVGKIEVTIETFGLAGRNIAFLLSGFFFLLVLPQTLDNELNIYLWYFIAYFIPLFLIIGSLVWSKNAAGKMLTQFEREAFFMVEKNKRR